MSYATDKIAKIERRLPNEFIANFFKIMEAKMKAIQTEKITYIVEHRGNEYLFHSHGSGKAEAEICDSFYSEKRELIWRYELRGAHEGKPLTVDVINPKIASDGDEYGVSYYGDFDNVVWAKTDESLPDVVCDFYYDELRDSVYEIYGDD